MPSLSLYLVESYLEIFRYWRQYLILRTSWSHWWCYPDSPVDQSSHYTFSYHNNLPLTKKMLHVTLQGSHGVESRLRFARHRVVSASDSQSGGPGFESRSGARFSKLPVITGPVKLFCFPFQKGVLEVLKIIQQSYQLTKQNGLHQRTEHTLLFLRL